MKPLDLTKIIQELPDHCLNHVAQLDHLYIASKVENKEQVEYVKGLGVDLVIDMKLAGEVSFDDKKAFEEAGIRYVHFPVSDPEELSFEQIQELGDLWSSANKSFLYCMSGNRVSAVLGIFLAKVCGHPIKRSLETAKKIGLTKEGLLEKVDRIVRQDSVA